MTTRLTRWLTTLDNFEAKMAQLPAVRRYGRLTQRAFKGQLSGKALGGQSTSGSFEFPVPERDHRFCDGRAGLSEAAARRGVKCHG